MRILDRYITKSIISIFLSSIIIFCFLYILIDVTSTLDEIIDRKVPFDILVKYYLSFFPVILVQTSAIACLISTLLTFSGLHNHNEILVMRTSGLNFWQITKPALVFGLIISAIVFFFNERFVPQATNTTKQIRDENLVLAVDREKKLKTQIENLTLYGLRNRLYHVERFNATTHEMEGVTVIEYDENQNVKEKIVALKGVWTGIAWKFFQCQVTTYDPAVPNRADKIKVYNEKLMDIKESPTDFLAQRLNVSAMNIKEIKNYIDRFSHSGASKALNNLRVDLHQKIAYPFGNLVIVLIALPFALMVKSRKGMTFTSLGIAVVIGFLYYVANALCLAFGKGGLFPPIVSAWCAPVLFSVVAFTVIETKF
jgi:lipopolysaccharide export system permease protein